MGLGPVLDYWRSRAGKPAPEVRDWTQSELAQFYRVEWALSQAGIGIETDRGLSDEGDPWFAFCRASDAEVVIHIAREGGIYLLAGFLSDRIQRGRDFGELVERLLAEHPAKSIDKRGESNVVMHPATLLALLVSIAFLQSNEGKAETISDHADDANDVRAAGTHAPPLVNPGVSLRSAATVTGSIIALAATFELAQAMTILRVANLMNQAPAEHAADGDVEATVHHVSRDGWAEQGRRAPTTDTASLDQHHNTDTHASSSLDMSAASLPHAQASIEQLLEIVAKLWTFPDAGSVMVGGLGVSAALAFFSGTANGTDDLSVALRTHQQARSEAASSDAVQHAAADQVPPGSTLTIIHTTGSSDSIAQTMLKLSFADQGEVTIKAGSIPDTGKLVSVVSELVAHAKGDVPVGQGSTALPLGHSDIDTRSPAGPALGEKPNLELTLKAEDKVVAAPPADKGPIEQAYTTSFSDGAIKHDVLNSAGQASVERAIAAFKEDVAHYSIAVSGKDVIFYSPDAVINHSPDLVVELWQFKDGSSIALVGLSVDGLLPYSL
jgi:hypothetical protein